MQQNQPKAVYCKSRIKSLSALSVLRGDIYIHNTLLYSKLVLILLFLLYCFIVLRCHLSTNVCGSTMRHLAPFLI